MNGGNGHCTPPRSGHDGPGRDAARHLDRIGRELPGAVERGEIHVAYQPIICLATGEVRGFEALARWEHPELGPVAPSDFIPIAGRDDTIVRIGQFVLDQACRELAAVDVESADMSERPLWVSVNVSKRQMAGDRVRDAVARALAASQLPPSRLLLEITESAVMERAEAAAILADLRSLGVRLAMDDFGIGHSSLGCLRDFPLDHLKIDRSFVRCIDEGRRRAALVHAVVTLGHDIGLEVVAEGVETAEQVASLQSMGCDLGQGFYFCKPQTPDGLRDFFRRRAGSPPGKFGPAPADDGGATEAA